MVVLASQVTIVEKADCSSVLPSPLSISTKSKMTFLFANLKDREFLVERISDFLQKMPSKPSGGSRAESKASIVDAAPEVRGPPRAAGRGQRQEESPWVERAPAWRCWKTSPNPSLRGTSHAHRAQGLRPLCTPRLPQVGLPASSVLHMKSRLYLDQPPSSLSLVNFSCIGSHTAEACPFGFIYLAFLPSVFLTGLPFTAVSLLYQQY